MVHATAIAAPIGATHNAEELAPTAAICAAMRSKISFAMNSVVVFLPRSSGCSSRLR